MSDRIQQDLQYQKMASLLNYESTGRQTVAGDSDSAAESENQYFHPEDEPTHRRFSQRGLTKLGFVSAGTILAFLVLGQIINQLFRSNPTTQTATQPDLYEEQDRLTMSLDVPSEGGDPEVGSLRTEVALQKQAQQLENMQAELQEIDLSSSQDIAEADIPEEPTPPPTVITRPAPAPPPTPIQPFTPIPIAQTQAPQPKPPTAWEQWVAISNSGTLGVVQPESSTQPSFSPSSPNRRSSNGGPVITRRPRAPTQESSAATTLISAPPPLAQTSAAELGIYLAGRAPTPGMLHRTRRTVAIGTTANAVISTPVLWPGDGATVPSSRDPNTPKYVVQLEEALTSADGQTVFPEGAKLVVAVAPIAAQSGIATLDVLSVIREDDGQSFAIPPGQLMIRGDNGEPLEARHLNDPGGSIFSMDLGLFAVSGLAEVGALMNRPEDQTINNSLFQGSVSTTYGDPNYLGAVLEGGSGAIAERMADRNDRAVQELAAQPRTWYLPQGTRVQLFVNQTMQIP